MKNTYICNRYLLQQAFFESFLSLSDFEKIVNDSIIETKMAKMPGSVAEAMAARRIIPDAYCAPISQF